MDTRSEDRQTLGFYRARLSDSDVLYDIIDTDKFPFAIPELITHLKNPNVYVFISAGNDAIVVYAPIYGSIPWLNTHSWTKSQGRGTKLKKFYIATGLWIIENTGYTAITAVIPDSIRRHGLFLAHCGAKRIAHEDGHTVYIFTQDRLKEFKPCLKD